MVKMQYHGVYNSALTTNTGCNQQIMTEAHEAPSFPAALVFECPMCDEEHSFVFSKSITVSSQSQRKNIYNWARLNSIITDVSLP